MLDDSSLNRDQTVDEHQFEEPEKSIRCKNCEANITSQSFAIEPHEHTFRNPYGFSFHILCFSAAAGAREVGTPTTEASWFPEHAWSFAVCQQCTTHLGWWYSGPTRFVGLIATRLIR